MDLLYELSFAWRSIRKKYGFSLLCILVIALGYSITIPLYSFVQNFGFAELPFSNGDRLVILKKTNIQTGEESGGTSFDNVEFDRIKNSSSSIESIGAFQQGSITLSDGESAQNFYAAFVTAEAITLPGVNPVMGRNISLSDTVPGADPVVLISYRVWQNYYGADEEIVGRLSRLDGSPRTIIGVMPQGFGFPNVAEVWLPLSVSSTESEEQTGLGIVGELREGANRTEANVELAAITANLRQSFPEYYANRAITSHPFAQITGTNFMPLLYSFSILAAGIFALVILNVGNLLIVRANERISELAVRKALGATRFKLLSHVLLESLIICALGTLSGQLLAAWVMGILQGSFFETIFEGGRTAPFWFDFSFNLSLFGLTLMALVLLWLLAGVFAAWRASRHDVSTVLAGHSTGSVGRAAGRITGGLVSVQVIASFFLLVISGSLLLSATSEYQNPAIENPESFLRATFDLNGEQYSTPEQRYAFTSELRQSLLEDNTVSAITFGSALPGESSSGTQIIAADAEGGPTRTGFAWVDTDYFQLFDIDIQQGRYFDSGDNAQSNPVVIVDELVVERMGLTGSPLGNSIQTMAFSNGQWIAAGEPMEIVGIAPSVGDETVGGTRVARIYRPVAQQLNGTRFVISQIGLEDTRSIGEIQAALQGSARLVDPDVPIYELMTFESAHSIQNLVTSLFISIFGAAAVATLGLAVIGVYGLISRSIMSRLGEIGIRRAVGSSDNQVLGIFMKKGAAQLIAALLIGGGLAIFVSDLGASALSNYSFTYLIIAFGLVTAITSALIFLATYVPARRTVQIEPGQALHYE